MKGDIAVINAKDNAVKNARLAALYKKNTEEFLFAWSKAFMQPPPCRMNEFGIIDIHRYDADNGILFIGRETNGWSDEDYVDGCLFRRWMRDIAQNGLEGRGHIKRHPNMWYNIGRWAIFLKSPRQSIDDIIYVKDEAIRALGTIAFTNVNKIRGKSAIGKEYQKLIKTDIVKKLIQEEVAIIKPKVIVCCGTWNQVAPLLSEYDGKILDMPHPGARTSTRTMLQKLKEQLKQEV